MSGTEAILLWGIALILTCWAFGLVALLLDRQEWAIEALKLSGFFFLFLIALIGLPIYFPISSS